MESVRLIVIETSGVVDARNGNALDFASIGAPDKAQLIA
jgi:hypothetical protein